MRAYASRSVQQPESYPMEEIAYPPDPARRWRWLLWLAGAIVLGVFAYVVWFAYLEGMTMGGEPPLVRADAEPYRVAPNDPGGLKVADQNRGVADVFVPSGTAPTKDELSPPPPPADPRELKADARIEAPVQEVDAASLPPPAQPAPPPEAQAAPMPTVASDPAAGRIEPGSGSAAATASQPQPPRPAVRAAPAPEPAPPPSPPAARAAVEPPARRSETPAASPPARPSRDPLVTGAQPRSAGETPRLGALPAASANQPRVASLPPPSASQPPAPAPRAVVPRPVAPQAASPPAAGPRGYLLQLVAAQTDTGFNQAWSRIRQRHAVALSSATPFVERAVTPTGTVFRLQAGPFPSRDAATNACAMIKGQGGQCFVVGSR